ncbi:Pimeloyl-ACP methyl ester carboxylesterase [Allopseudospirillum japonicum]|uniref:Pimeloyl-ACP methyl ester carboxylesterase n=1 Tax=Allopseudospirillum japonicum TaxID=64971 RepID=A0A1H6RLP5_9GAMM|nr:alpha/beta hydrolase [Allopseudospirillum japonicum]SEI56673.1 Pimeloyl-ACP methyl ester carboxylesterase [Allopseudospirillum japonicum]
MSSSLAHFQVHSTQLTLADLHLHYHLYQAYQTSSHPRPLLLLHGAGVAGQATWEPLIHYLGHQWPAYLVPDLRGMGASVGIQHPEAPFDVHQVCADIQALLTQQGWESFDVIGYSFGGLIAMLLKQALGNQIKHTFLIEPALLEREDVQLMRQVRQGYSQAAAKMRVPATQLAGITEFLDLIAPLRSQSTRVEQATLHRLAHRVLGFSYALDAVTHAVHTLDRAALLAAQNQVVCFYGGRSPAPLRAYQAHLSQQHPSWASIEIAGTDHALPYQKPKRLAHWMMHYLADGA